jgi:hypothetical protein
VRARFTLAGLAERSIGEFALRYRATVDIEGTAKPALAADWITLAVLG